MQDKANGVSEGENSFLYEGFTDLEVIDRKGISRLQDRFCKVANVFAFCADAQGRELTEMSGCPEDAALIRESVSGELLREIYDRVREGSLEDQVVEDTEYDNLKVAAVSIKFHGKPVAVWLICAVLEDAAGEKRLQGIRTVTTERRLYEALDLLRETCLKVVQARYEAAGVEAQRRRTKNSEQEMSESLRRIEAFAEIVQLLDNDNAIELVLHQVLKLAGGYLKVSSAQIFRLHQKTEDKTDLLTEWLNKGVTSIFEQTRSLERPIILYSDRTVVISTGSSLTPEENDFMKKMHLKAVIAAPISIHSAAGLYVSFCECGQARTWKVDEIKFINDTVKIIQSILTRRLQKNSLASSYEALEAILDNVGTAIYVKDMHNGKMLFANRTLKKTFEKEFREGRLDEIFTGAVPMDKMNGSHEVPYQQHSRWYDLYYTTIRWVDGTQVILYAAYDITDKKIYQKKIEKQAYTDFLTGLYNRMCCEKDLAWHIDEAKKDGTEGALLYLDLDDFKHINDGLGHQYGDVLLKAISHSLKRIEGIDNTCYRMGGDEFVIIIPPVSIDRFELILRQISEIFEKPWFLKDADYYCTMSMGIVKFPSEGENVQELIKKADIAMYEAKKSGKNRMAQYNDNLDSSSSKRLDMEKNMRDATVGGYREFEVYYQPIIDNRKKGSPCTGAEALVRWNSAELGFISPGEFIPLAEYLGLINPIGNHVLMQACMACKDWNDSGEQDYKVNVNLSVVQLLQPDIVEIIKRTLVETGLKPQNLTLEVTESLAINDMDRMKEILASIRALGVRIALDDFGTGYSSLNHIREIPLDVIKVDQSFVKDLARDSFEQSFIKMVSELADAIGVNVCVEGIETKEQYEVLEGMKVSLIQGYYFDKPMPETEFEKKYVVKKTGQERKRR